MSFASLIADAPAILFDFDGVVVDSERIHYEAYRQIFAEHGHALSADEYWGRFTDRGEGVPAELAAYGLDLDADDIKARKKALFAQWCRDGRIPFADRALEALAAFADHDTPATIASNTHPDDIAAIFAAAGQPCPLPIVGRKAGMQAKPAPDVFFAAAEHLGVAPAGCVVLEDARKGVEAAVAAGMLPVVVRNAENAQFDYPEACAELAGIGAALDGLRSL